MADSSPAISVTICCKTEFFFLTFDSWVISVNAMNDLLGGIFKTLEVNTVFCDLIVYLTLLS